MKHRILIADDDESGRSGLAALLSMWGYEVQECVDGKDALERAPGFRPSVVIADMIMPVIDGIGLLGFFKVRPVAPHQLLSIVFNYINFSPQFFHFSGL